MLSLSIITFIAINKIFSNNQIANKKEKNIRFGYVILIIILLIAFTLRIIKLDELNPFIDEYYNLVAAKHLFLDGTFFYDRSKFITWILGAIFSANGGTTIFWGRFVVVIIGIINTLLIYLIGRRYNKWCGYIAAFLFATLPLAIGLARFIREYEFILLFTLSTIYLNLLFHETKKKLYLIPFITILCILGYYFFAIERNLGILLVIIINIIPFYQDIINLIRRFFNWNKIIFFTTCFILLIGVSFVGYKILIESSWFFSGLNIEKKYIYLFFYPGYNVEGSFPNWYLNINFDLLKYPIFIIFGYPLIRENKKTYHIITHYLLFIILVLPFLLFTDRYFAARYVYTAYPFFILIISTGIYLISKDIVNLLKRVHIPKFVSLIIISIFFLFFFSPYNAISSAVNQKNDQIDTRTGFTHYEERKLIQRLYELGYEGDDVVITTLPNVIIFNTNREFLKNMEQENENRRMDGTKKQGEKYYVYDYAKNVFHYHYGGFGYNYSCLDDICTKNEKQRVAQLIDSYEKGWLILDYNRNELWTIEGYPLRDFQTANSIVDYIGKVGNTIPLYIYKWDKK
ncbi:MAG: glycosyltransferase family 39 protein [Candidatus Dojkabacteria bacterium]|nr:glycosyltransferase family 39 protein [Candidatus Dojkabacteria bacterium]